MLEIYNGQILISHHAAPYDDRSLYEAFEQRAVPERDFIYQAFFGGRFSNTR